MNNIKSLSSMILMALFAGLFSGCNEDRDIAGGGSNNNLCGKGLSLYQNGAGVNYCIDEDKNTFIPYDESNAQHQKMQSETTLYRKTDVFSGEPSGDEGFFFMQHGADFDRSEAVYTIFIKESVGSAPKKAYAYCADLLEDGDIRMYLINEDNKCDKRYAREYSVYETTPTGYGYIEIFDKSDDLYKPIPGSFPQCLLADEMGFCSESNDKKAAFIDSYYGHYYLKQVASNAISSGDYSEGYHLITIYSPKEDTNMYEGIDHNLTDPSDLTLESSKVLSRTLSRAVDNSETQNKQICKAYGDSKINLGKTSQGQMICEGEGNVFKDGAILDVNNTITSIANSSIASSTEKRMTKTTDFKVNRSDLSISGTLSCPDVDGTKVIQREITEYIDNTITGKSVGFYDETNQECSVLTGFEECTLYEANPDNIITISQDLTIKQSGDKNATLERKYSIGSETLTVAINEGEVYLCGEEE